MKRPYRPRLHRFFLDMPIPQRARDDVALTEACTKEWPRGVGPLP